jgi:hypothetical protein
LSGLRKSKKFSPRGRSHKSKSLFSIRPSFFLTPTSSRWILRSPQAKAVILLHDRIINVSDSTEIAELAGSETRTLNLHGGDLVVLEDDPYKTSSLKDLTHC